MVSVYQLKAKFQNILRPLTKFLAARGVSANQVTSAAFILSTITGALIYFYDYNDKIFLIIPFSLFIRMGLNAIDGMLAREHNQKSRLGAVLNELGDILSDTVIYTPFLFVIGLNAAMTFLIIVLSIITETAGIIGVQINASRRYDGPMGKSDRAFWFSVVAILAAFNLINADIVAAIMYIIVILLFYTIINRIKNALKEEQK